MPDGTATPETNAQSSLPTEHIAVGKNRLGVEITKPGTSYDLGNTFSNEAAMLGGDRFSTIYFRTVSGNIYCLTDRGDLISANESKSSGQVVSERFDTRYLSTLKLTVGEPLRLTDNSGRLVRRTSRISQIVAITSRQYQPDYLQVATQGKSNNIMEEFSASLPSPKTTNQ